MITRHHRVRVTLPPKRFRSASNKPFWDDPIQCIKVLLVTAVAAAALIGVVVIHIDFQFLLAFVYPVLFAAGILWFFSRQYNQRTEQITWKAVAASALDLILAAAYLLAWIAPAVLGEAHLEYLFWLVIVEALSITVPFATTCLFLKATLKGRTYFVGFFLGAIGATLWISSFLDHWWPLVVVAMVGANKLIPFFLNRDESKELTFRRLGAEWAFALAFFYLINFLPIARLGWTGLSLYPGIERELPNYIIIVFGFYYFLCSAFSQLIRRPKAGWAAAAAN